jgi:hypothetical protein
MKSATRKETTMKAMATRYVRLVAILAVAAPIAAFLGNGNWH